MKAADDFASKVGSGKGVDKDKIHKRKGKGTSSKKKHRRSKIRAREIPSVIPMEKKKVHTVKQNRWKGSKKRGISRQDRGEKHRKRWKEKHRKKWFERKKQRRQEWRQSKEGSKVTYSDVECFFVKLMKGANEEDWIFFANFERDDHTRIYDHKIRSVYNAESLPWTWRYILTRFNRKHILCSRSLPCADRARKCLDELCWKIEWKHHFLEKVSETLPFRVPYQLTAVFNQRPCPSLRGWLHRLKSAVFSVLQEDRS